MNNNPLYLQPLEQLFQLNAELSPYLDKLKSDITVVGGQAVAYWFEKYREFIPNQDTKYIQSNDVDYMAKVVDLKLLEEAWQVDPFALAKDHPPPSLAIMRTQYHNAIKADKSGRLFISIDHFQKTAEEKANIIDVIDFPAGFRFTDFTQPKKHSLYTAQFEFELSRHVQTHQRLRILTPIACLKSRLANLINTPKDNTTEIARIKLLQAPLFYHLQDKLHDDGFNVAKESIAELRHIILSPQAKRAYKEFGVDLRGLFSQVANCPGLPENFLDKGHPKMMAEINAKYLKIDNRKINLPVSQINKLDTPSKQDLTL